MPFFENINSQPQFQEIQKEKGEGEGGNHAAGLRLVSGGERWLCGRRLDGGQYMDVVQRLGAQVERTIALAIDDLHRDRSFVQGGGVRRWVAALDCGRRLGSERQLGGGAAA
ncbi:unnamed protein product [Cuscuta epithymum]|uniref:Uncharacterized protein n=1 Tax=Cuscuta epithymum TaxID=186058 RepID=A0AAV0GEY7_9ASTE|nr:unnamed protein product [Cuscuta epithymum]